MRAALVALLCLGMGPAGAQPPPAAKPEAKAEEKKDEKAKPRPRVQLKRDAGSIGDDAPGGGAPTAPGSKGGTPGTPSGSFTR